MARTESRSPDPPAIRDRIVALHRIRAGDLRAHPHNWRRHPERQRRILQALLAEIGYADALLAYRDGGHLVLVDGHLRKSLDPDQVVPVLELDLTPQEADLLLATLDPLTGLAVADPTRVAELHADVQASSEEVRAFLASIAKEFAAPGLAGRTDPDDIPGIPDEPRTRPGDFWLLGEHRVLCADSTDPAAFPRLVGHDRVDVMWTDPPYGVDYVGKTKDKLKLWNDHVDGLPQLLEGAFSSLDAMLKPGAALYVAHPSGELAAEFAEAFRAQGWRIRQTIVWVKDRMVLGHGDYHYRHEPILYGYKPGQARFGRGQGGWFGGNAETSVFEIARPSASREHPTAKPVELVRRCLQNSSAPGHVIADPFLGSGTTLIAAHQLGRRLVGIELDPRYVDVAVSRWEAFTGQEAERG